MKKAIAYAATAIILGFALMMLPKIMETQPTTGTPMTGDTRNEFFPFYLGDSSKTEAYGLASQPLNLLPSSLIFLSGLIAALAAYTILKRRII